MANELEQKTPLVELLSLAAPTVAQSVSYTIMQFIDIWMLSRLGTEPPTAAANAGMLAFSVICFGFGIMLIVNTLVSQAFGRGEFSHCGRFLWQGIWVGVIYSLLVLPMIPFGHGIFHVFGHSDRLAGMESTYLRIVLLAVMFKMIGVATGQFLLGTNRPTNVFISAIIGVGVNSIAAYIMVLGRLGAPRLGIVGSAWAQNLGVFTEMCVLLVFALSHHREKFGAWDWRLRVKEAWTLIKIGLGAGLQIVADVLAWTLFLNAVMSQISENAMAANQFMFRYMVVSFMPAVGISQAVTALVGRYIGMKRPDLAMQRANLGFTVAAIYMFMCGVLMVIFRYPLIQFFSDDPEVVRLGAILLIFGGVYQLFDAMYLVYNGALRGAGDTLVPAIVTAGLCWGVTIFGGFMIAKHLPQLGVAGPWTACMLYGIALGIFCMARFRRGGWKTIHLEEAANSNVLNESATVSL